MATVRGGREGRDVGLLSLGILVIRWSGANEGSIDKDQTTKGRTEWIFED